MARFGVFALDLRARELRKNGSNAGLPEQSIKILALLLERPGEVILREEIRKKLWPNDTVVEFDHSINTAMKRLRQALGDSPDDPQFIETLARRGYRWMVPVEWVEAAPLRSGSATIAPPESVSSTANLTGKKISHYRVLEILGGGGMGVIYKAEDIKLGRRVALKFLPEELASKPAALERFEREARAASALDHPNICAIHEFGEHEGQPFIVMQLLEGRTLRERIGAEPPRPGKPLPTEELLDVAVQVARGLEAAHQKGIIHRDIRPANIFLTNRGEAKILDFGVAKLVRGDGQPGGASHPESPDDALPFDPSSALNLTRTGTTVGTASYMSPEQILGEKLDARTDLFSFGLVLHEMATGQQAFAGETAALIHEAILNRSVRPARELNPELPSKLEEVVARALLKDRNARYQTASELRADLESVKRETEPRPPSRWWAVAAGVVAVGIVVIVAFWFAKRQSVPVNPSLALKQRQLTSNSIENNVRTGAISPDGKYLAYTDRLGMHVKLIETGETQAVPQPDELKNKWVDWEIQAWFPDGTSFLANSHPPGLAIEEWNSQGTSVWIVSVLGGSPHKIRDEAYASSISPDGKTISFISHEGRLGPREIWLMDSSGENPRKLYETDENSTIGNLNWSPDGTRTLYDRFDDTGHILFSRDLKGGAPVAVLPPRESNLVGSFLWLPDDRVVYALQETDRKAGSETCNFWQLRIDPRTGELAQKPRRITNWAEFCVDYMSVTSNSKRLVFTKWHAQTNVYVADFQARGNGITTPTRLTLDEGWNSPSGWTSDSKAVFFWSSRDGVDSLFKQSLGQLTPERLVTVKADEKIVGGACLSPEGSWVFYMVHSKVGDPLAPVKLMRVPMAGGSPQLVLTANLDHEGPHCARSPATLCAVAERSADHKQLVFTALDPVKGRGRELAELQTDAMADYSWHLSQDGARIAVLKMEGGRIQILSLSGGAPSEITVKGWNRLKSVVWSADGRGLIASSVDERGSVILKVDLQGNARILWEHPGGLSTYGSPSPDGRHLALLDWTVNTNFWMMENF